jgi:hypothetical protein
MLNLILTILNLGGKVREYYYSIYHDRETVSENQWVCKYCGKDTSNVEYDYLSGSDHLSCVLSQKPTSEQ